MKVIAFDLDGTLIDTKHIHRDAFLSALKKFGFEVGEQWHDNNLCGLPTVKKIEKLENLRVISSGYKDKIIDIKNELTYAELIKIKPLENITDCLNRLSREYKLYCCSNAIKETVEFVLKQMGIFDLFTGVLSNNDVVYPKPSPEIYLKVLVREDISASEMLIVEDSPIGIESARKSCCPFIQVSGPQDISYELIKEFDASNNSNGRVRPEIY